MSWMRHCRVASWTWGVASVVGPSRDGVQQRGSGRKWGIAFVVLTVLVVLFYLAPYVAPSLGLVHSPDNGGRVSA
ncbi:protein of unknown function [Ralstonia solanacearum CMR15]|nr:protein of unknown function [Ralstonia solanacearum CMR15]